MASTWLQSACAPVKWGVCVERWCVAVVWLNEWVGGWVGEVQIDRQTCMHTQDTANRTSHMHEDTTQHNATHRCPRRRHTPTYSTNANQSRTPSHMLTRTLAHCTLSTTHRCPRRSARRGPARPSPPGPRLCVVWGDMGCGCGLLELI